MGDTRSGLKRLIPRVGDIPLTNKRRPLKVVEDMCGVHDTLMSACDIHTYQVSLLPPINQMPALSFHTTLIQYHLRCSSNRALVTQLEAEACQLMLRWVSDVDRKGNVLPVLLPDDKEKLLHLLSRSSSQLAACAEHVWVEG